jgi:Ca2+-binding RTX toxin-like protein
MATYNLGPGDDNDTGTSENDGMYGNGGNDTLHGGDGNDTINGGIGDDILYGDNGDDDLGGSAGNDILYGGAGNDILDESGEWVGTDTLYGGTGNDTFYVNVTGDAVTEYTNEGIDTVMSLIDYTLGANFENLTLFGTVALHGTGNNLANTITGTGVGDTLDGGAGNDTLNGSDGTDTATYQSATAGVTVSLAITIAQATGGSGSDTLLNIENLTGSDYADTLTGNATNNTLNGMDGNDLLNGWAGADILIGGSGADIFAFGTPVSGNADTVLDFSTTDDTLRFRDGTTYLDIGDNDHVIDGKVSVAGPGGFAPSVEVVIVTSNISGTLTPTSAAAAIGSADATYGVGDTRLFAVDNGTDSAIYRFQSAEANAIVGSTELILVATLQGTASTALADYTFL